MTAPGPSALARALATLTLDFYLDAAKFRDRADERWRFAEAIDQHPHVVAIREVVEVLAGLSVPTTRPKGNAGFYSLFFDDIEKAKEVTALLYLRPQPQPQQQEER
jgi:hypothetical protein